MDSSLALHPERLLSTVANSAFGAVRDAQDREIRTFHDEVQERLASRYSRRGQQFSALAVEDQRKHIHNEIAEYDSQLTLYVFADGNAAIRTPLSCAEQQSQGVISFASIFQRDPDHLRDALLERNRSLKTLKLGAYTKIAQVDAIDAIRMPATLRLAV